MPEKSATAGSKMSSSNKCSCCPYGFHIDRDFVRYCDSLYNSAQLDKLRQHKRERRKEKKSVESYLGLGNITFEGNDKNHISRRNSISYLSEKPSQEFYLQSDDLKNAVSDFEDTWKKSLKKNYSCHSIVGGSNGVKQSESQPNSCEIHDGLSSSLNSDDIRENRLVNFHATPSRSSSMSSVSSQSTSLSHVGATPISDDFCSSFVYGLNASLSSLSKPLNNMPQQTVGIHKSVLTNIREQMASSLHRMKELEEQVKSIPALKGKLSTLYKEKKSLLNELKVKENIICGTKYSKGENELEKLLKKLENEGIMSPTLSRKCLSLKNHPENLFSPGIASSLDATMIKKKFIEREIISHIKMNDAQDCLDKKNKKSIGTSCAVLTRDIGVGYVPNRYKSIGVGNDISLNDTLNLYRKGHFEKLNSLSSESLESDVDSLSGISDIPRFPLEYHLKTFSTKEKAVEVNVFKSCVDSFTNTNLSYVDKCINTEKDRTLDSNVKLIEKTLKHKSISVSPSMSNKYIQVSNKCSVRNFGSQTLIEIKLKDSHRRQSTTCDIGVGDFTIQGILCDSCKKSKKSVAVGDSDIRTILCSKCEFDSNTSVSRKCVGVGDFDINSTSCKKCENDKLLNLSKCSVGINTSSDLSSSTRDIRICDKCSETIHSVAQDLAADSKETSLSKLKLIDSKMKIPKSKLLKHKSAIQPLKINQTKLETNWSTVIETKQQKEVVVKRFITQSTDIKDDDKGVDGDTDNTAESPASEILPNFTNLPALPKKKNELNKEIKAACKVLNDHLQKADRGGEKKMLSSLNIIQTEWFRVANQKKADPHLIEDYLDAFEEFSKLLLHKIVNLSDSNGNTALHYAVSYGNFDVVSILIDSKVCDVNMKNKAGYTSIMLVALAEMRNDAHHYVVQRLFSIGDINVKATQNGQTALMLAVSHGKKDIVKILLDVGAEVNLQDKDGSTALMCAAEHGHLDIAKILLSHSECDPTIVDNDGCNALTIAMEAGHKDIGLLIYTNMNFSRGSSPYSTLKTRKRSTPRSTPPPHTPTLRTPPLPSPATKSMSSLSSSSFQFPT